LKRKFWLIDVSAENVGGSDEIWIWGLTKEGKRCVLREKRQKQRFYLAFDEKEEAKKALRAIKGIPGVISCKLVDKRSFGVDKKAVEIICNPSDMDAVVKGVKKVKGRGEMFEEDIRFSNRFLLDNDISPSSWYEAEVEESDFKVSNGIDETLILKSMRKLSLTTNPKLKIMGVDFVYFSEKGSPDPEKSPLIIVSIAMDNGKTLQFHSDEKDNLNGFIKAIKRYDPDVIVGFRTNSLHWQFLMRRSEKNGMKLEVGRLGNVPHQSLYGHFSIAGRINFDLRDYAEEIAAIQRNTLEELAEYLGVEIDVEPVDEFLHSSYWLEESKREKLLNYSLWRAKACLRIFQIISDYVFSLSSITGIPSDYVFAAAPGFRLENYLMRAAVKFGELIPKVKEKRAPTYPGGKVLSPKKGVHEGIAVVDFKAMYPSLMLKYNISPDTVKSLPYEGEGEVITVEEAGTYIIQDRKGFFTGILENVVRERDKIKKELKRYPRGSPEYRFLDATQKTLKVLANAMYGYMGWIGARWYLREGAQTVTALGRRVITQTIEKAREMGLEVIYGDTDSLFIKYDEVKVGELLDWINKDLGLEAKIDKIYERVIFTEAKKRYAGLTVDGEIDIVGLEAVRGDWCRYAKETQKALLEKLLKGERKNDLLSFVRERVVKLKRKQVDLMDLVIWKQLAKKLDEYEVNAPHVVVASRLVKNGWRIDKGDFVGFVVVRGIGPIYSRAKHYSEATIDELDFNYYIDNQVIPVCARVLSSIGIKGKELKSMVKAADFGMEAFFG